MASAIEAEILRARVLGLEGEEADFYVALIFVPVYNWLKAREPSEGGS